MGPQFGRGKFPLSGKEGRVTHRVCGKREHWEKVSPTVQIREDGRKFPRCENAPPPVTEDPETPAKGIVKRNPPQWGNKFFRSWGFLEEV